MSPRVTRQTMSMKKLGVISIGFLLLITAVSLASPVLADTAGITVNIKDGAGNNQLDPGYSPATITVVIGVNATVTWVNGDTQAHTVTDSGNVFNSGNLAQGKTYTYTFTTEGTYNYICTYHSWMKGTVIVKSAAVPEFPVGMLALILLGVIAVAAVASGRIKGKTPKFPTTQ